MWIRTTCLLLWFCCIFANNAQGEPLRSDVSIVRTRVDGLASFLACSSERTPTANTTHQSFAQRRFAFLEEHGALFGINNQANQLVIDNQATRLDSLGFTHATYRQIHHGVAVFSGVLNIHQSPSGQVRVANGDFYVIPDKLSIIPRITLNEATNIATVILKDISLIVPLDQELTALKSKLVIVDPGWYGDRPCGPRLAYYFEISDLSATLSEAFFIDALTGHVLDHWSLLHTSRFRIVYEGVNSSLPGILVRQEADPPVVFPPDVNSLYDYLGDTYDFFARAFARDGIDDQSSALVGTAFSQALNCPNAAWNGEQSFYCPGTTSDDVVGHEYMHGVTQYTANLIYQNQSGQLNESYSDIFGELVDLFNGDVIAPGPAMSPAWPKDADYVSSGTDTPNLLRSGGACSNRSNDYADGYRWLVGEDAVAFGGAIRDMWNPPCRNHPDYANSVLQTCNPGDNGGVHSGSGVPNHAFAMLSDGNFFRNQNIIGIGVIKAAAVWYRALTVYLTPASDFADAYAALNQAANDLVDSFPLDPRTGQPISQRFTIEDTVQVDRALRAVEMDTDGRCGAVVSILNPGPPPQNCNRIATIYENDFEQNSNGWTVEFSSPEPPTPYNWELLSELPLQRAGTAWFCDDPNIGNCDTIDETGLHSLISPPIDLPIILNSPTLSFTHFIASEPNVDGGNLSISVNGEAWQPIPLAAIFYNSYNAIIMPGSSSPLSAQAAYVGFGGGWGTSLVDLGNFVDGGETIQIRFDFGKDGCSGLQGWFVDDVHVYICGCDTAQDCNDGNYCNGSEACIADRCEFGSRPCGENYCEESTQTCATAAFWDDFELGRTVNWSMPGAGSTALDGDWLIANPRGITTILGQASQPEDAYEGLRCAFTGQNTFLNRGDVDDGITYLVSPPIDLSGVFSAELSYQRWFFNSDMAIDPEVFFRVEISEDDGDHWLNLETLDSTMAVNQWIQRTFQLKDFIGLGANARIRFSASDNADPNHTVEAAIDNVVVKTTGNCQLSTDCDDGITCTLDFCSNGNCVGFPMNCASIIASDPPSGSIDAGQPNVLADNSTRFGWASIEITFDAAPSSAYTTNDFELQEIGGDGLMPTIVDAVALIPDTYLLTLSEPIEPGTWTIVRHLPSGQQVCLGFLPGDVTGNGSTNTSDILSLVDALNAVAGSDRPSYATDINRSNSSNASDLTRLIDLLNGAGALGTWLNAQLPPNPCQ